MRIWQRSLIAISCVVHVMGAILDWTSESTGGELPTDRERSGTVEEVSAESSDAEVRCGERRRTEQRLV